MAIQILLLGRYGSVVEDAKSQLRELDVDIHGGTCIEDVRAVFANNQKIEHVFMGAGIELEKRLEIVKEIFHLSATTTVHLKEATTGPQGFLPFVKATLTGIIQASR